MTAPEETIRGMLWRWVKALRWADWAMYAVFALNVVVTMANKHWTTMIWVFLAAFWYTAMILERRMRQDIDEIAQSALEGWRKSQEREKRWLEELSKAQAAQNMNGSNLNPWGNTP